MPMSTCNYGDNFQFFEETKLAFNDSLKGIPEYSTKANVEEKTREMIDAHCSVIFEGVIYICKTNF